MIIIFLDKIM